MRKGGGAKEQAEEETFIQSAGRRRRAREREREREREFLLTIKK
jgi:hypothetical protein